jgi:restriction system protein
MGRSNLVLQVVKEVKKASKDAEKVRKAKAKEQERIRARQEAQNAKEAKLALINDLQNQAESMTEEVNSQIDALRGILSSTIEVNYELDLESLLETVEHPDFYSEYSECEGEPVLIAIPESPELKQNSFKKALDLAYVKLSKNRAISSQRQRDSETESWKAKVQEINELNSMNRESWSDRERLRQALFNEDKKQYKKECKAREKEIEKNNSELLAIAEGLPRGKKDSVEAYMNLVLEYSEYPTGFEPQYEIHFDELVRQLSFNIDLASPVGLSEFSSYRLNKSSMEIIERGLSPKEISSIYEEYVCNTVLSFLHQAFSSDTFGVIRHAYLSSNW